MTATQNAHIGKKESDTKKGKRRDRELILAPLDLFGPMTVEQLLDFSQGHPNCFPDIDKIHKRLRALYRTGRDDTKDPPKPGLIEKWTYNLPELNSRTYYTLTSQGYRFLKEHKHARSKTTWHFCQIKPIREGHTHALIECLIHTNVCARRAGVQFVRYRRENSELLEILNRRWRYDSGFGLLVPHVLDHDFFLEMDCATETEITETEAIDIRQRMQNYELRDSFRQQRQKHEPVSDANRRQRILWVTTGGPLRCDNLRKVAAGVAQNPHRRLHLFITLDEYRKQHDGITGAHWMDHTGDRVPLVWLPRRRYWLLATMSDRPVTRRRILRRSRQLRPCSAFEHTLDDAISQLQRAGWVRQHARRRDMPSYVLTDLGRRHLPGNTGIPSLESPTFSATVLPSGSSPPLL